MNEYIQGNIKKNIFKNDKIKSLMIIRKMKQIPIAIIERLQNAENKIKIKRKD